MGLTAKQKKFVHEYIVDENATQAYIRAGYSEQGAGQSAHTLLKSSEIQGYLAKTIGLYASAAGVTPDNVIGELARMAFVDPRNFFREDGSAKHPTELDDDTAGSLAGMELVEEFDGSGDDRTKIGYLKKFKIADKGVNLERLGRILKLFTDKTESTVTGAVQLITTVPRPEREPKA